MKLKDTVYIGGGQIWTSGNDGASSGLDADLWDGNQFSSYLNQSVKTDAKPLFGAGTAASYIRIGDSVADDNTGGWNKGVQLNATNHGRFRIRTTASTYGALETYYWADSTVSPSIGIYGNKDTFRFTGSITTLKNVNNDTFWHSGNDGAGSGLDADTLDGNQATAFAAASHTHDDRYYTETESDSRYLKLAGGTMTGTLTAPTIVPTLFHYAYGWRKYFKVRSVGVSGGSINNKWVHLFSVEIGGSYDKALIKAKINGYDDVSIGTEVIQALYENGGSTQENHDMYWYSIDNTASLFKTVKSIRTSASGLRNTYEVWVQMAGDWRDTFTMEVEFWEEENRALTFGTANGQDAEPSGDGNDITKTSRQWAVNSNLYIGGNITLAGTVDGRDIAADGTKLDGIASGANNYSLPAATASALGGIKIGTNLSIDANGVVSSTDTNTWRPLGTGATDAAAGNHLHDDRYYTESEVDTLLAGKQAAGSYLGATAKAADSEKLDGADSTQIGNRNYTQYGFTVGGDANTYYPVVISGTATYAFNRYSITRRYADTAPWNPIGTGVHHGGLTFDFYWSGDTAWGGNDKTLRVHQFSEQYTTMVAGLALARTGGVVVWLRGGTAYYKLQVDGARPSVTVYLETFVDGSGARFDPRTNLNNVSGEIYGRMPVRGSSELYDGNTRVSVQGHTHDDRYYTESEVDTLLGGKAASSHTHAIGDVTGLQTALDGKAASSHTHAYVAKAGESHDSELPDNLAAGAGGFYTVKGTSGPSGGNDALIHIPYSNNDWAHQMAFNWSTGNSQQAYFRTKNNGTWQEWKTIIHSGNISSYANNYSLPVATASVLGGVKDGTNVNIDANGVISVDSSPSFTSVSATANTDAAGYAMRSSAEVLSGEGWATALYNYNNNDGFLVLNRDASGNAHPVFHIGGYNNAGYGGWSDADSMITLVRADGTKSTGSSKADKGLSTSAYYSNIVKTTGKTIFRDIQGLHEFSNSVNINGVLRVSDPISVNNRSAMSVAHWAVGGTTTGAIMITLPGTHTGNWSMLVLRITAYEYSSNNHSVYYVSGHDWTSGWYNNGVTRIGTGKDIRLGYNTSTNRDVVVLGAVDSRWEYGHVTVDVVSHPSFYTSAMDITSGWDIRQVTDLAGYGFNSVTNRQVLDSSNVGSYALTSLPSHTHDDRYYTESEVDTKLATKAASSHTHDDRYYTESEVDTLLAGKLSTTGKAADAETVDGVDSSRIVYGANERRSTRYDGEGIVSRNQNSGFYYGYDPDGGPYTEWWNWLTVAGASWTSSNNYDFKLAHNFHGDDLYVSRMTNGTQYSWRKIIDSANIGSYALTSLPSHTHDDRYYTESETDTLLAGKAASSHTHGIGAITDATRWWNNFGDNHTTRRSFDAQGGALTTGFGWRFVQGSENGPGVGNTGNGQYYALTVGLGNDYDYNLYGMQIAIPRTSTTPYLSVRFEENRALGAWQKISAGYADSAGAVAWGNVSGKPTTFAPSSHTHDDRYYTETEVDTLLNAKGDSIPVTENRNSVGKLASVDVDTDQGIMTFTTTGGNSYSVPLNR